MKRILILSVFCMLFSASFAPSANPTEPHLAESNVKEEMGTVKDTPTEDKEKPVEETIAPAAPLTGIAGFFERMNQGIKGFFDQALKGSYKVATLGQDELKSYEIEEPEKGSKEPTKIKIGLPGT